jgi:hypothetical protein
MDSLRERPPCSSRSRRRLFPALVERNTLLYDWIIEADIHRLKKALADAPNERERSRLEMLLKSKQRQLARNRDSLLA